MHRYDKASDCAMVGPVSIVAFGIYGMSQLTSWLTGSIETRGGSRSDLVAIDEKAILKHETLLL